MRRFAFICLLVALSRPASGVIYGGNRLVEDLREFRKVERGEPGGDALAAGAYLGFIVSSHDTLETLGKICAPKTVEVGQIAGIVERYLESHPEKLHFPASDLVIEALLPAFPCPSRNVLGDGDAE